MSATPTMSRSEFAAHLGVRKSYITKLGHAGRLVLTDDGKQVIVDATKRRIAETRDPNRQDVVDRHAELRADPEPEDRAEDTPVPGQRITHAEAKAAKEFYLSENARLDYEERCGRLVETAQVRSVAADAVATFRAAMEGMPAQLAPVLTGRDEAQVQAMLAEHIEQALTELSKRLNRLGDRT